MTLSLNLQATPTKVLWLVVFASVCALVGFGVVSEFIIGVLNDTRVYVSKDQIEGAAAVFPSNPTVQSLLAQAEIAEATDHEQSAARATEAASRAVAFSPSRYDLRLLLASARELTGDRQGAEQAFRAAVDLAPNYGEVHWRLANFLIREGKLQESLEHYRVAVASQPGLMAQTLPLIWSLSNGDVKAVSAATPPTSKAQLELAMYLLRQPRLQEATDVFLAVDPRERRIRDETGTFLQTMINIGMVDLARRLWVETITDDKQAQDALVWNGSFETDPVRALSQFDWSLNGNRFVKVAVDGGSARTGSRSLRLTFNGIDTTRLDNEIRQLVVVKGGRHYRLECYVKTKDLDSPEGPRLVVTGSTEIASSQPIANGSNDWQPLVVEFTPPADSKSVTISIKRIPKFSYDDPTKGTVWFDDFVLKEG